VYALLALARTESFVVRRDKRYYALVDHNAAVISGILAVDLLDTNQFGGSR
jgi:hypothetical protein